MHYLDDDILFEILVRLPAQSLLRFKCVCRRWHSLISDPMFAKAHLRMSVQESPNPPQMLLLNGFPLSFSLKITEACESRENRNDTSSTMPFELEDYSTSFRSLDNASAYRQRDLCTVQSSCHGLLCLQTRNQRYVLANPTTREAREMPRPLHFSKLWSPPICGLGYDALHDDYKFVLGTQSTKDLSMRTFDIYSLKSGSWKSIGRYYCYADLHPTGHYSRGFLYWLDRSGGSSYAIVSFNVAAEKFCEYLLPMPSFTHPIGFGYTALSVSEGGWIFARRTWGNLCEVWVMKDCHGLNPNWTKLCYFSVEQICKLNNCSTTDIDINVYPVMKGGKIFVLVAQHRRRCIGIYDPKEDSLKILKLPEVPGFYYDIITYVEGLVSLRVNN